jgi:hypothetical protein
VFLNALGSIVTFPMRREAIGYLTFYDFFLDLIFRKNQRKATASAN